MAENNIQNIIYLKHSLTLVEPMRQLLRAATSPLMVAFAELLADARFALILDRIASVVTDDTHFEVWVHELRQTLILPRTSIQIARSP